MPNTGLHWAWHTAAKEHTDMHAPKHSHLPLDVLGQLKRGAEVGAVFSKRQDAGVGVEGAADRVALAVGTAIVLKPFLDVNKVLEEGGKR